MSGDGHKYLAFNGGAVVAMAGKHCVALASDMRFGREQYQTVSSQFPKLYCMGPRLYLGMTGLISDIQTVSENMQYLVNLYELNEHRQVKPQVLTSMLSKQLYGKRFGPFYVESIVAGLQPKTYEPFLASLDILGGTTFNKNFSVTGTCKAQLYGMCEPLWKTDLDPLNLFEVLSQVLLNAVDRDALSGWGATVCIIEPDRVTSRTLKARMD